MKLLFAAAEIIRRLDQGERIFFSKLNQFYSECIKDNSNRTTPTLEQFDGYLYQGRRARTVWSRNLDEVQKPSRKKHLNKCVTQ